MGGENDREGFFFFSLLRTRENVTPIGASGSCECVRVVVSTGKNDLYARSLVEDGGERERDTTVCDGIYIYRLSLCWLRPVLLGPSLRRLYAPPFFFFFFFFPPEQDEILLPSCDNPCDKKRRRRRRRGTRASNTRNCRLRFLTVAIRKNLFLVSLLQTKKKGHNKVTSI